MTRSSRITAGRWARGFDAARPTPSLAVVTRYPSERQQGVEQASHARVVFHDEHLRRDSGGIEVDFAAAWRGHGAAEGTASAASTPGTAAMKRSASAAVSTRGGARRIVSGATVLTRNPAARNACFGGSGDRFGEREREPQPAAPHTGQQGGIAGEQSLGELLRPPRRLGR